MNEITTGFSGARVWREGDCAVKQWPTGSPIERVQWAHQLQTVAAKTLPCVPALVEQADGRTWAMKDGLITEVSRWQRGKPVANPSAAQLADACGAIAALHHAWRADSRKGIAQVLRVEAVNSLLQECHALGKSDLPRRVRMRPIPATMQPVHGDLHREHILFSGDAVTGLIDFSSIKLDHPTVDLARYLGDLEGERFDEGVQYYNEVGGSTRPQHVERMAGVIAVGILATWTLRLARNEVSVETLPAVQARLRRYRLRLDMARQRGDQCGVWLLE